MSGVSAAAFEVSVVEFEVSAAEAEPVVVVELAVPAAEAFRQLAQDLTEKYMCFNEVYMTHRNFK